MALIKGAKRSRGRVAAVDRDRMNDYLDMGSVFGALGSLSPPCRHSFRVPLRVLIAARGADNRSST
jgi:hypothetical protein